MFFWQSARFGGCVDFVLAHLNQSRAEQDPTRVQALQVGALDCLSGADAPAFLALMRSLSAPVDWRAAPPDVLGRIVDHVLSHPEQKLVAYGTLRPGQPNASLLANVDGAWSSCVVRGSLREHDGYPELCWSPDGPELEAMLLTGPGLVARWDELDAFEGERYVRRLVRAHVEGRIVVANCYLAAF